MHRNTRRGSRVLRVHVSFFFFFLFIPLGYICRDRTILGQTLLSIDIFLASKSNGYLLRFMKMLHSTVPL